MLFDTHVHVNDPIYEDYQKVIDEAYKNNVKLMVAIGYDLKSSKRAVELANKYDFIYASVGIHPSEANIEYEEDLKEIEKLITNKVVAIGEIGLDYHYENVNKIRQEDLFVKQINLASKYNLPILIHSRDACKDTYDILKKNKDKYKKGIMHCYSYSLEMAKDYIKLNLKLGIGGVVTYKNGKELKEVVKNINLEHLVLETDAPYLTPTPFRGTRNEPKYIEYVAKEIASLKEIELDEVEKITFNNACELFEVKYEN